MAEERAIIYEVKVDIGELTRKAAEVQTEIEKLKAKQKELTASGQKNSVEFQNNATQLRQLQTAYRDTTKEIDLNIKATVSAKGSNEQLRAALALQTKAYNALSQEQREGTAVGRAMGRGILDLTSLLKENESAVGDNRRNVGNYANSLKGLERQLDELNERVSTLDIGSEEFKKVQAEITKTRDKIGIASGAFDEFGDRVKKGNAETLDTFNDVGQGIVAAFAIAPLFGENQAAAELQANALKAIAVAQNAVAISKGIANAKEAAGIIVTKLSTLATKANEQGQKAYTAAVGQSTGALRVFKVVAASTGILALVGLLVMAADAMGVFSDKTEDATEKIKEQEAAQAELMEQIAEGNINLIRDETERAIKLRENQASKEIKILSEKVAKGLITEEQYNERLAQISEQKFRDIEAIRNKESKGEDKQNDESISKAKEAADKKAEIALENKLRLIRITKDGFDEEIALFDEQTRAEVEAARKRGVNVNLVEEERRQERQKIIDDFNAKEKEKADAAAAEEAARIAAEEKAKQDQFEQNAILAAQELEQKKADIDAELALEKQKRQALMEGASDVAGALVSALSTSEAAQKKNAEAIKALSASQALINGLLAVQKAWAAAPFPANLPGVVTVGIATGVNVSKILSTPAFARGGLTGKRISWGDGVPISRPNGDNLLATVRTGEVILNEKHQRALGGPRTFRKLGVPGFADGGFVNDQIQQSINANFDMQGLKQAMREVQITVGVDEIAKKMARVRALETNRTL